MKITNEYFPDFEDLLKKYISKGKLLKFFREFEEGEADIYGFLLKISDDFFLIQNEVDFLLNGFSIVRKEDVDAIRHNKYEKATGKILVKEGILKNDFGLDFEIEIPDWQTIFDTLEAKEIAVTIECEDEYPAEFFIGFIKKVKKNSVFIQHFSATGKLENKLTKVPYAGITTVKFGDRYSTIFSKYLK